MQLREQHTPNSASRQKTARELQRQMKHHHQDYQRAQLSTVKKRRKLLVNRSRRYPAQPGSSNSVLPRKAVDSRSFYLAEPVLTPWTEVVGTISEVMNGSVLLECRTMRRLDFPTEVVRRHNRLLKKGTAVGILMTDSGHLRVRRANQN